MKKLTQEEAISKCQSIHGDRYDYSETIFNGNRKKMKIRCREHGVFEQIYFNHIKGCGCMQCGGRKQLTTKEFIDKSKLIHPNKFTYDKVSYVNNCIKVTLSCIVCCKDFDQEPSSHLMGCGCPYCAGTKQSNTEEFIIKAKRIHNDDFNYDRVLYVNKNEKVIIKCNVCQNDFLQTPDNHLQGNGCPHCKKSRGERLISHMLKDNQIEFIYQKSFIDCQYKRVLPFDFYIPKVNVIIEYDGVQHFESVKHFGGEKKFEICQIKDEIKNKYCEDNKIKLIRIPYWLPKEDIEEILINDLFNSSEVP